jgi:hypothetical protein
VSVTTAPDGTVVLTNGTTQERQGFFRRLMQRLRNDSTGNQQ